MTEVLSEQDLEAIKTIVRCVVREEIDRFCREFIKGFEGETK